MMIRNCFVREEGDCLILCAGIPARWLDQDAPIRFGPAPTSFGAVTLTIMPDSKQGPRIEWQADWHDGMPEMDIRLPGFEPVKVTPGMDSVVLVKKDA